MNELYVVDAVNYIFRSYYAIAPMTNKEGHSTSALYGFIRSLQKLIQEFQPEYLVAVFDGPDNAKTRRALYPDYKKNRKEAPQDLYTQIEWAYQFCSLAGIPALCKGGVEADDTIASIATWAQKEKAKVFLCTADKDLCQLVSENIFVLNTHKQNQLFDTEKVHEFFGVYPSQMLDLLAMMGDASDNIPGIAGFGPKTSSALLKEFGSLEKIFHNLEKIKGKKKEILQKEKEKALLSKRLASLDLSIPIPQEIFFYKIKEPDRSELSAFYRKMGFFSLLQEPSQTKDLKKTKTDYILIQDKASLKKLLLLLTKQSEIVLDTETTHIRPFEAELVGIGFCIKQGQAYYVAFNGPFSFNELYSLIKPVLENPQLRFIGHNLKYDLHVLENHGFFLKGIYFDTLLASYVLSPEQRRHNLDLLTLEYFHHKKIATQALLGKGKNQITMKEVPLEKVAEYCSEDVDFTLRLKTLFSQKLKEKQLDSLFFDVEMPLLPVLAKMERRGIFLDVSKLEDMRLFLEEKISTLEKEIYEEVGLKFNLNSPKQLSEVLFQRLGLKNPGRKKTEYSTGAKVLEMLSEEHAVASKVLQYRGLEKLRSTYVNALIKQINPKTKRIHPTFNQSVTATGRLSCQDPNLQNIPIRTVEGKKIREGFEPQKQGWVFLSADYSQIELRLLAHFSEDPSLIRAFQKGEDIHASTASSLFQVPLSEVTEKMRHQAKAVNFGILYGQSAFGLSEELRIPVKQASLFIQKYKAQYPEVQKYLQTCIEGAEKKGVTYTLIGRQRPIPEIHSKNPHLKQAAQRLAINTPLQGSSADIIKLCMIQIEKEITQHQKQGFMILQVHDELIFEIPEEELPFFQKMVKEKMETVVSLKVPLTVNLSVGKNWGEC